MSKKQLDELLGLETFNPLVGQEKIKGGNVRRTVITYREGGPTVQKRLVQE